MNNNQPNDENRFDRLEALIRSEVGGLRSEMVNELGGVKAEVGGLKTELGGVKAEVGGLKTELGGVKAEVGGLRAEMVNELGGVKAEVRGLSVRVDALHGQIKIVAEGYGALVNNISDVRNGIDRLELGQGHLELRMLAVESRLDLTR